MAILTVDLDLPGDFNEEVFKQALADSMGIDVDVIRSVTVDEGVAEEITEEPVAEEVVEAGGDRARENLEASLEESI